MSLLERFPNAAVRLREVYGESQADAASQRYEKAISAFLDAYGEQPGMMVVSAPGRIEVGGNHTDHNCGHVLAAAVSLDVIAVVAKSPDGITRVISEGNGSFEVDLSDLSPRDEENSTSASLVRGVAAGLVSFGYQVGPFLAYVTSSVLVGSGLSSSAAFESMLGAVFSHLYNEGKATPVELAVSGKLAENEYYKKPSGMMDQTATANGGFVAIDFEDTQHPVIEAVQFDIEKEGYAIVVVATGDDHENLTDQYASMPIEMKSVANYFGKDVLREITREMIFSDIAGIRKNCGDRAFLRAVHFFDDDKRAVQEAECLRNHDFQGFLQLIRASGLSSIRYLQNISDVTDFSHQGIALALCLADDLLGVRGACRVHGGGFAGTTLNFVPKDLLPSFIERLDGAFRPGSCIVLSIRKDGAVRVL
ncbi:MAG: galactokinase [Clostridia bacterium]|nr:galactokinase [Clostridia bacterium]